MSLISLLGEYSVPRFSDLRHLVLKHGRYNYLRVAKIVYLFIYKNFMLALLLFSYIFYSDYSGQPVFEAGLIIFYNILFTTLPVIAIGVFE
jgi:phospholipid-translocating ATPase